MNDKRHEDKQDNNQLNGLLAGFFSFFGGLVRGRQSEHDAAVGRHSGDPGCWIIVIPFS